MDDTQIPFDAIIQALSETSDGRAQLEIATLKALTRIQAQQIAELRGQATGVAGSDGGL